MVCPSTPALLSFRLTARHPARSVSSAYTLSIRLYHRPPFTPLSRASSMRSVQTLGSVHPHRGATSLSRLADRVGTAESFSSARLCFTHHLPASLCSTPVTALPGYYGGSDFRHPAPFQVADLPDSHRSGFRPFCLQTPDDLPPSLSHALLSASVSPLGPFPVCVHRAWGFAIGPQARQHIRSNRGPHVRTGRSPSVALHPALRRRSYGRLWSMSV